MKAIGQMREAVDLIDHAVIDVGSNSVRLVIFRTSKTFFQPIFNEKVTASLGKGLKMTGMLNQNGVPLAKAAIARYVRIIKARNIQGDRVHAVATAAVRDADNGPDFLSDIKQETGLAVTAISGKEEARLSALGVIAGEPTATGLMADLGGSSLELVKLSKGETGAGATYRLGPLAVGGVGDFNQAQAIATIQEQLAHNKDDFNVDPAESLYAVGGAWRSLALVHMELRGYPLHVLHNYKISRSEAKSLIHLVRAQSPASLAQIPRVSTRRAQSMAYAALLLEQLLDNSNAAEIVISSYGLREGLLQDQVPEHGLKQHPLHSMAAAMAQQNWASLEYGEAAMNWLQPVFEATGLPFGEHKTPVLAKAACMLADLGARMHPDHRAEIAFDLVLHAPFPGVNHAERVALALTIFHRYAGAGMAPSASLLMRTLDNQMRDWSIVIGLGLRCAAAVSGRTKSLLECTQLEVHNHQLILNAHADENVLLTSSPERRLNDLATAMRLTTRIIR